MRQEKASKVKLLKIVEILKEESDGDHYITTGELLKRLSNMGIECERQTLYNDIDVLNDYGYEILSEKSIGKANKYCIINREFEISELKILIDAIQSSSFITPKKTIVFIDKLASQGGSRRNELLNYNSVKYNAIKHSNEQIFYLIEDLSEAIKNNKQISFQYFDYNAKKDKVFRKGGERYIVNPYSLVIDNNNYYLIAYSEKYQKMIHYRLDRMMNMNIEKTDRTFPKNIDNFNLSVHKKQVFGMFVGNTQNVTIEFDEKIMNAVIDKFGEDENYIDLKNGKVSITEQVQVSPQFISWVCEFGKQMKVTYPIDVVEKVKSHIEEMKELYEE